MSWGVEMVVGAVVLVVGLAALAVGVAGSRARLPRNRFAGVRTAVTLRDDATFALGNRVAAPATIASGAITTLTGMSLPLLHSTLVLVIGLAGGVALLMTGGVLGHRAAEAMPEPDASGCAGCAGGRCAVLQQQS